MSVIGNPASRKDEQDNSYPWLPRPWASAAQKVSSLRERRNRAAQLFREREEERLKQLKADFENLKARVSASHAGRKVLRDGLKDLYERALDLWIHNLDEGWGVLLDRVREQHLCFRALEKFCKPLPESRGTENSQETHSQEEILAQLREMFPDFEFFSVFEDLLGSKGTESSQKTQFSGSVSADDRTHTKGYQQSEAFVDDPTWPSASEVADEKLQERHNGGHLDINYEDTEAAPRAAVNDDSGVQQNEDQFKELQLPANPIKSAIGSNVSADLRIQPDTRWTKISKSLVDARVLDNSHEQYEEKTDEFLVFRLLTKEEIDYYIFKTQEKRESKARVLKEAPSSRSPDGDLKDPIPVTNEAALTEAIDIVELERHLEGSKQDDRDQLEEKLSVENATSATEDRDDAIVFYYAVWCLVGGISEYLMRSVTSFGILGESDYTFSAPILESTFSEGTSARMNPGESVDVFAPYVLWYASWCLAGCLLVHLVIPETNSHTIEEFNYTFSAPLRKHAFFKIAKMKWLSGDTRQKLRSLFRSWGKQLWFSEGESARLKIMNNMNIENILSLTKTELGESSKKQRLHGQCRCGYRFYDDFVEVRPMAVAEYGESLVRRRPTSGGRTNPVDQVVHSRGGDDIGPTRSQSSDWSSFISNPMASIMTIVKDLADKKSSAPPLPQYELENGGTARRGSSSCNNELLYLLMCIPQHQYATKLLQPQISAIRSDQDFFLLLRNDYRQMRGRIKRLLSLKALRSIKFVQLEMYRSELVDIRKQDDLPPEDKKDEYRYNPVPAEMIPPVGENHMLHLINHPTHADEDGFVLDRIPKKLKERLLVSPSRGTGIGWGIYFIEGWHVSVVTIVAFAVLLAGSLAFLICWSVLKHDLQGASGVAAYIIAFLGLAIGSIQAIFELT
ncbi:MAG: hypothetical protein Q9195_008447 [Heterodermia aff. obscurata]